MSTPTIQYKWNIAEMDRQAACALAEALDVPPILAHLLMLRGIHTAEAGRQFLTPGLHHLSDPGLLTGMAAAVERITRAREKDEAVFVFGDYDVDGVAATAILINGLRRFGINKLSYGMPVRLTEGYGLNPQRVEEAHQQGVQLIVTVDNGISAHDAARLARKLGIDLIITDHHTIEAELPDALAVVNPKQETPDHPAYHLCGAGVAFKLSCALNNTPNDLDIAALGTVADIVPLVAENRAIVALGVKHMMKHRRLGLAKLATAAGFNLEEVTSERIGFQLGPRINAAGRLQNGIVALELLFTECPDNAAQVARTLNEINTERRTIENQIYDEAVEELDNTLTPEQRSIVIMRPHWHVGVIGIVASRLYNRYHRPVIMISLNGDGIGRGSGRSGPGFDMVHALQVCENHLIQFGGHRSAAGLVVREDQLESFRRAFEAEALLQLGTDVLSPELDVDVLASFSEIDGHLIRALEDLEPIGHENPAPIFCTLGVEVVSRSTRILKERHLKMTVRQGDQEFDAIGFNMAERFYTDDLSRPIDIAYTPQFNTWNGNTSIQLLLKDIQQKD